MGYIDNILADLERSSPGQAEFYQAAEEVLGTLDPVLDAHPRYREEGVIERMLEPEQQILFRVAWTDDQGQVRVNKGYRVQFNSTLGPCKGGLRFHPSVNAGIIKFLGFEQIFKNSLTGLPIGGGKGGSDFDPKGCSNQEIMRFCQAFMTGLYRHIGSTTDVPAGDIGVGRREIGYLYGQYRRLTRRYEGVLTGKAPEWGGSAGRAAATGRGCVYFAQNMLSDMNEGLEGKICLVSGAGNVAFYTIEKLHQLGARAITCSDSSGALIHPAGIDLDVLNQVKNVDGGSLRDYTRHYSDAQFIAREEYSGGRSPIWQQKADLAFPCATQNEIDGSDAEALVNNGIMGVSEGANMPCDNKAVSCFLDKGICYGPGKAANAGGVAVSQLEMQQNAAMARWPEERVDAILQEIMQGIYQRSRDTAREYGQAGNLVMGANTAGFIQVADAMLEQGVF